MYVVVILKCDPDSWTNNIPTFAAIAENNSAAMRWIQDEVDGKHRTGSLYMPGKSVDWWIKYGTFQLKIVEVFQ